MKSNNYTPFLSVAWESADHSKQWYLTSLTRVRYRLQPNDKKTGQWELRLTKNQGELFGGDVFYEDDYLLKPVRYESDFITYKPNTDIVLNAYAYKPISLRKTQWSCGIKVLNPSGELLKSSRLKVSGEEIYWEHGPLGWFQNTKQTVERISLRYDRSEGGSILDPNSEEPTYLKQDQTNPVGTGIRHSKMPKTPFLSPQVEWDRPILNFKDYPPGFGFIHRGWKTRMQYAGSYNQEWLDEQHPYPPKDFNFLHNQSANPELILEGHIDVNSRFELENLIPDSPFVHFSLPELYCFVETQDKKGQRKRHRMVIDTVLLDIESDKTDEWAVLVSYRHYQPINQPIEQLSFHYLPPRSWIKTTSPTKLTQEHLNG